MLIFSTQKNLTHLAAADIIYGDGTFYSCPSLFFQLYTFHAMVDGVMYPLVHSSLPAKTQGSWLYLKMYATNSNYNFSLPLSSWTMKSPSEMQHILYFLVHVSTQKAVFFYYTQCIWRKAQETGIQVLYKEDNNIHQLVCCAAVLPLVPTANVKEVWFNALTDIDQIDTNINYTPFTDYVTTYWSSRTVTFGTITQHRDRGLHII